MLSTTMPLTPTQPLTTSNVAAVTPSSLGNYGNQYLGTSTSNLQKSSTLLQHTTMSSRINMSPTSSPKHWNPQPLQNQLRPKGFSIGYPGDEPGKPMQKPLSSLSLSERMNSTTMSKSSTNCLMTTSPASTTMSSYLIEQFVSSLGQGGTYSSMRLTTETLCASGASTLLQLEPTSTRCLQKGPLKAFPTAPGTAPEKSVRSLTKATVMVAKGSTNAHPVGSQGTEPTSAGRQVSATLAFPCFTCLFGLELSNIPFVVYRVTKLFSGVSSDKDKDPGLMNRLIKTKALIQIEKQTRISSQPLSSPWNTFLEP